MQQANVPSWYGDRLAATIRTTRRRTKQTELAAELGVHAITVSKCETGVHAVPEPVAKLLRLLASAARPGKRRH